MKKTPVFLWQDRVLKKIYTDEIYCLVTERNYTKFFLTTAPPYMVRCTLDSALKILPADEFVKIYRRYAVSINFIQEIGRDYVLVPGEQFPLSRQYYKPLMKKLLIIGSRTPPAKESSVALPPAANP